MGHTQRRPPPPRARPAAALAPPGLALARACAATSAGFLIGSRGGGRLRLVLLLRVGGGRSWGQTPERSSGETALPVSS